jgi:integrase
LREAHTVSARRTLPTGIRKTTDGWQAYVWIADHAHPKGGYQASRRFAPDATISEMKAWRMKRKLKVIDGERRDTFADEARVYLARDKVQRMPTSKERHNHIRQWMVRFGDRDRHDIAPYEIQEALDAMRRTMSAGSVNKRRTALMDLWTVLDGRHQANPVKATRAYPEPEPEPRAPAMSAVLKILAAMPAKTDYGRKCRARVRVIAWTGWPHAILKQITEDMLDLKHARAYVPGRSKGKGSPARWLPLLPEAVRALKEFHKEDAYGPFSNSSLHKRFKTARDVLHLPHVRPYDFRHFFGTLIATVTCDERAVQDLMLLRTVEMARRYTRAATDPRTQAAVKDVAKELPGLLKAAERVGRIGRVSRVVESPSVPERDIKRQRTARIA